MAKTSKPAGCAECPLREKGLGFVPDKVAPRPKYLFIGEAPGKNEVAESEPFVGKAGFVLKQWGVRAVGPMQLAMERGEVTLANTLRCLPPEVQGRPYPKGDEKLQAEACCSQYNQPLDAYSTVVLFGESPQRRWFNEELTNEDASDKSLRRDLKGVGGRIGRVYERNGKRFVFAPHPAWVLRQPSLVQHLQESLKIAANTERMLAPDYLSWTNALQELGC
jgi:uracil-DNA glycosylase family 4